MIAPWRRTARFECRLDGQAFKQKMGTGKPVPIIQAKGEESALIALASDKTDEAKSDRQHAGGLGNGWCKGYNGVHCAIDD